ncbi:MAG: flavin reductase [Erysipelotrichaceae bacterium]
MNPFEMIGKQWMLVTAKNNDKVNTMTASWGGLGVMWGKEVAFVVIRPQRYTKEFIDASNELSLSFYKEEYRKALSYFGSVSGKDEDKINKMGFHTLYKDGIPYFEEAETILFGKVLYKQPMEAKFLIEQDIDSKWYSNHDYHELYIVEITNTMKR